MLIKLLAPLIAAPSHMVSLLFAASAAVRNRYASTVSLPRRFLRFEGYTHSNVKDIGDAAQICQRMSLVTRRLEAADMLLRSL